MKRLAHYSQYFLRSPHLVKELVGHTSIKRSDLVYDIGAGSGAIAAVLAMRCKQVVAVEAEPRMAKKLKANMRRYPNVTIHEGDFLAMALPSKPYKVFANIPFHLSSAMVQKLTQAGHPPEAIYLIVQKQFAKKLLIDSDHFTGQLGASIAPWFTARIRKTLQRTDFWPHPNVDTVLLELQYRSDSLLPPEVMSAYKDFIVNCFSTPKFFAKAPLKEAGVSPGLKPSQLQLNEWIELFLKQK